MLEINNFKQFEEYQNSCLIEINKELENSIEELDEVDFLLKSYKSIDYINELLEVVEFDSNTKPELVNFISTFKTKKARKNNKIDISFFEQKWQKNIKKI